MIFDILKNRINQGYKTTKYPKEKITLPNRYKGLPKINRDCSEETIKKCVENCPQDAISYEKKSINLGRCTFCGLCEDISEGNFIKFTQNFEFAFDKFENLEFTGSLEQLSFESKEYFRKLFGRSLQLRQVSAGGCNACEADINVLNTPFFDLSRFGIQFVASPRHADGIVVTGPVTVNMKEALIKTYNAIPEPKVVIASGSCAISGGPFRNNSEQLNGVQNLLKVDLFVPGCPPHPLTFLYALLKFFK